MLIGSFIYVATISRDPTVNSTVNMPYSICCADNTSGIIVNLIMLSVTRPPSPIEPASSANDAMIHAVFKVMTLAPMDVANAFETDIKE